MRALRTIAFALVGATLAACGGGGGGGSSVAPGMAIVATPTPAATSSPQGGGAATASFAFTIPSASSGSSAVRTLSSRRPQFVSSAIESVAVFAAIGSAPLPPTATTLVNVGPTSSVCTPVSTGTTCTINVPAVYGLMTFSVKTYSGTLGSGSLLSTATLSTTITVGQQPIPLTLTGIVNAVYLSLRTTSLPSGSGTAILDVNAEDASGNIIVGPGNYNVPISVAASDPSVALSATTVSGPNQPITVTVAKPTEVRFTANASGLSGNAFTPAVLTAGSYSVVFVGENSKNAILEFPSTASFPLVPLHQISESQDIEQIAANASGELAVALADGTVQLFNPGSVTPSMTVTTGLYAQGLALDASGNWYILGTVNGNYEIATYPQGSSSPTNIISGPATGIVSPGLYDLAVDGSDTLYELDGYGTLSVNEWTAGHQNGNVAPTSVATIPGNFGGGGIAAEANGSLAVIAYANTVFGQATINFFAPGATTPSSSWSPVGNADAIAYGQNGDLFIGGTGATVGVLAAGTNPSGAGYSRSFGPPGGDGFAQPLAVGGSGTPTAPAVTTVSGDFIAPAASKTWNYAALPATGVPYTVSVYSDPSPDTGGNIALVGFDYGSVVPDAAAAGGYVVGAIGLSAASGGGYIAKTFGSVTNDTYGPVPGTPILIPGSVTLGQSFTPYPGVTETVTGVGAVAGMSACPGSPTTGAVVAYTLGHISESISFVPGCGITDLVTDNGTEFRLTSITQDPQLGQQSVARATRNATTLDLLRSMWKRVFRPWVKL